MEDTWTDRDLPVLRAAVKVFNPDTTLGEDADPSETGTSTSRWITAGDVQLVSCQKPENRFDDIWADLIHCFTDRQPVLFMILIDVSYDLLVGEDGFQVDSAFVDGSSEFDPGED